MAKKQDPRQLMLRPEVAEKYTATRTPGVIDLQRLGRRVDLTRITVAEADELVQDPTFTYLVLKKQKQKRAAPAVSK
ncbi:hypothetical protein [Hymenobacter yonginensis]|uniref:Uncharacterized protein n=1 Tax=Hymenobacter yonginensis TaxID=748197 RepID=A0ABY7PTM1_9BACT|nr:hypothetical protein [Hymenobacter yonginensis]WBO86256.1 hypothetical protein O9Z63_08335 [Hymenobacter yonginensis]